MDPIQPQVPVQTTPPLTADDAARMTPGERDEAIGFVSRLPSEFVSPETVYGPEGWAARVGADPTGGVFAAAKYSRDWDWIPPEMRARALRERLFNDTVDQASRSAVAGSAGDRGRVQSMLASSTGVRLTGDLREDMANYRAALSAGSI